MPTWIAFQRAVNVGGRKFPMAELRAVLEDAGYEDVATHIQTGNIRLGASARSATKLEKDLEALFLEDRGFEVPTVALRPAELAEIGTQADAVVAEFGEPEFGHYVEIMRAAPASEDLALIEGEGLAGQRVVVRGRAAHLLFDIPFHEAKPPRAAVKRAYGVSTNRNIKVVRALVEKWC
jgi:uncharacterized protein (DUF1697 family)